MIPPRPADAVPVMPEAPRNPSRRAFLRHAAVATTAAVAFPWVSRGAVLGANSRLNIAGIGVGGKGWVDITHCDSQNIVGLCDVDADRLAQAKSKYPGAVAVTDWRELLEKHGKSIDAVTISTPDHMHFPPAMAAIRLGKHVYCQKPLTHTVWEARQLRLAAHKAKVATQMGNQGISHPQLQREAEIVRAGACGRVRELHLWTDRPGRWWRQGLQRGAAKPVPANLAWDLWLGVAPERPYADGYHAFAWRGHWDFGTGALGDMGCHLMNLAALVWPHLEAVGVEADSDGGTQESPPLSARVTWELAGGGASGPRRLVWYDGGRRPSPDLFGGRITEDNGVLVVGDKDTMLTSYEGGAKFLSGAKVEDFAAAPRFLPHHAGWQRSHYEEWIAACKGGPRPVSNFDVAGPVSETILLGNIALRTGQKFRWDARRLKASTAAAHQLVSKAYRPGFGV